MKAIKKKRVPRAKAAIHPDQAQIKLAETVMLFGSKKATPRVRRAAEAILLAELTRVDSGTLAVTAGPRAWYRPSDALLGTGSH